MKDMMIFAALLSVMTAQPAAAASYGEQQPFICAPIKIVSCLPSGDCEPETAETVNVPQFLRFDVARREIKGKRPDGEVLTAAIDTVRHNEENMTLQGMEGQIMWSVMIDGDSGEMILVAGGNKTGFVAFGACTLG